MPSAAPRVVNGHVVEERVLKERVLPRYPAALLLVRNRSIERGRARLGPISWDRLGQAGTGWDRLESTTRCSQVATLALCQMARHWPGTGPDGPGRAGTDS